jgi:hypothetical protein
MPDSCKCANGHEFTSRVLEDSPDINVLVTEDDACPECDAEFVVTDVDTYEDELSHD